MRDLWEVSQRHDWSDFVNVLADAGFELTYDQIADALWLAKYLPKPSMSSGAGPSPVSVSIAAPLTPSSTPGFRLVATSPTKALQTTVIVNTDPRPGELFVPKPGIAESGKCVRRLCAFRQPRLTPDKAGINAALRPLKRRFPSTRTKILDVTATVEQIARRRPSCSHNETSSGTLAGGGADRRRERLDACVAGDDQ